MDDTGSSLDPPTEEWGEQERDARDPIGQARSDVAAGARIGPYRLVEPLGSGGMGEVWRAEQDEPLRRTVALKLIRAGMDSRRVVARFEAERQALALMDHPNIAKVFDAGWTLSGAPFFVMEYVPGLPITDYCDRRKLTIEQRLTLFTQVCDGVQHAHQKAVIHRDLKPSNVLVEEVDGRPVPKIIDFGLVKAVEQPLTDRDVRTELGIMVGTPVYMSPEQASGTERNVDVRTDVYALGAMLYELLVGEPPFGAFELRENGLESMLRRIREDDPPRPSAKLASLGNTASAAALDRRDEPRSLARRLRGELDWITLKALDKDRNRRYASAADLAADINRHVADLPVAAGPPSARYRAGKFARRHRFGVSAAAAAASLLVGFAALMTVEQRRTAHERDRANQEAKTAESVASFLVDLFRVSDPSEARGNTVTAREILDTASRSVDTALSRDPAVRARLLAVMGAVYDNLGLFPRARTLLQSAVSIQSRQLGPDHSETLRSSNLLAQTLLHTASIADAETLARRVCAATLRQLGPEHPDTLRCQGTLASILEEKADYVEAEKLDRAVLATAKSVLGDDHVDTYRYRQNLAMVMNDLARYADAESLERESLDIARRTLGPDHPATLNVMNSIAVTLGDAGRFGEAEKMQRELLAAQLRVLGGDHLDTLRSTTNLANFVSDQGRYPEAERLQRDNLAVERRVLGSDHPETVRTMDNLANTLSELERYSEAESLEREALSLYRRRYGNGHPSTANAAYDLACILAREGRPVDAIAFLRESVDDGLPAKAVLAIETDSDLASLHGDPRFETLVASAKRGAGGARDVK